MVEDKGIEPLTYCLQGSRSPNWANPPYKNLKLVLKIKALLEFI